MTSLREGDETDSLPVGDATDSLPVAEAWVRGKAQGIGSVGAATTSEPREKT
jgi:hypothetical protein